MKHCRKSYRFVCSSRAEVRFPVNIGITGHVATTGQVMLAFVGRSQAEWLWTMYISVAISQF